MPATRVRRREVSVGSKMKITVMNVREKEFELLLQRTSDYLRKQRKGLLLAKPRLVNKKRSSAA